MYTVSVTVMVKPDHVEDFIREIKKNADGTRKEPGNIRFDVAQGEDDKCRFLLYEVYHDKDAFVAHQKTEHYLAWKAAVADWMAVPRVGVKHDTTIAFD